MKTTKQNKLEQAGWSVGSAADFLNLSEAEETVITMKMALATKLKALRKERHLTQQQLAKNIGSSQSRVAKMEVADKSVSIELFVKSLISLGTTREQIGKTIGSRSRQTTVSTKRKKPRQTTPLA